MRCPAILEPYLFAGNGRLGWHWGQGHALLFSEHLLRTRSSTLPGMTQPAQHFGKFSIIVCHFRYGTSKVTHEKGQS